MALDAAVGCISEAEDALRTMLSTSTNFQAFTNSINSTEALARIYHGEIEGPTLDEELKTEEEMIDERPYAEIWTENYRTQYAATGPGFLFANSGVLGVRLVRYDDHDLTGQENYRQFTNWWGQIVEDLWTATATAGSLDITAIDLQEIAAGSVVERAEIADHNETAGLAHQYSDLIHAIFFISWSTGAEV